MSLATNQQHGQWPWRIISAAVLLFAIDELLKKWAQTGLEFGWPRAIEFKLFLNQGLAFSLGRPGLLFWSAIAASFAVILYVGWVEVERRKWLGFAFLFATFLGGLSNLADRLIIGSTVDYLIFFGVSAVNIADALVVGGLIGWLVTQRGKK